MGEESVVVGVRVRPFNDREKNLKAEVCLEMNGPTTSIFQYSFQKDMAQKFSFDESFWSHDGFEIQKNGYAAPIEGSKYADQRYVYNVFGQRVLDNAWAGFHCCLFAYGQTGAGKSYSMVGYGANKGIVPISTEEIFSRIASGTTKDLKFEVTCSMIEIYNEAVQDLLVLPEDRPKKGLEIRESKLLGIYIEGVSKRPVASYKEIEATVEEATEHRTVGATLMNATSSRAHTVVAIEFKQLETIGGRVSEKISIINLVDLAGSEKAGQTGATGDRLKEGSSINKSLSALGNVIEKLALRSGGKKGVVIPYRDSKLTRLLQNALGGSSKTIMICALSPASSNYEETLSTLRYADRAKKIKNTAIVNENPQDKLLRELKEENIALKEMMEKMKQSGCVDVSALNIKQAEIAEAENALKEMQRSFEEKYRESKLGVSDVAKWATRARRTVKTVDQWPHLANLNEDMTLTGKVKHEIPTKEGFPNSFVIGQAGLESEKSSKSIKTKLESDSEGSGSDSEDEEYVPDIRLAGVGIYAKHATVTNEDGKCYFTAQGRAAEETFVNGKSVAQYRDERVQAAADEDEHVGVNSGVSRGWYKKEGILLEHGDRIAIGRLLFVFVNPADGSVELMVLGEKVSYMMAIDELEKAGKRLGGSIRPVDATAAQSAVEKELRDQLEKKQKELEKRDEEIKALQEEVEDLKLNALSLDRASSRRNCISTMDGDGYGKQPSMREIASISRAKELAAQLNRSFNTTAKDLKKAMEKLDDVRKGMNGSKMLGTSSGGNCPASVKEDVAVAVQRPPNVQRAVSVTNAAGSEVIAEKEPSSPNQAVTEDDEDAVAF